MELHPKDIFLHLANILVLYALLRLLLHKPVSKFLRERAQRIAGQLDRAKTAEEAALAEKTLYAERLAEAGQEAERLRLDAMHQAGEAAEALLESARHQAEELINEAREKTKEERREALKALQGQIADMALNLAAQILKREVGEADNRQVIDSFFERAG